VEKRTESSAGVGLQLRLPQHADQHGPERPILLAVDQQLGECAVCGRLQHSPIHSAPSMSESIRPGEPVGATTMLLEAQDAVTLFI
jgi:hypothetical protein